MVLAFSINIINAQHYSHYSSEEGKEIIGLTQSKLMVI